MGAIFWLLPQVVLWFLYMHTCGYLHTHGHTDERMDECQGTLLPSKMHSHGPRVGNQEFYSILCLLQTLRVILDFVFPYSTWGPFFSCQRTKNDNSGREITLR